MLSLQVEALFELLKGLIRDLDEKLEVFRNCFLLIYLHLDSEFLCFCIPRLIPFLHPSL